MRHSGLGKFLCCIAFGGLLFSAIAETSTQKTVLLAFEKTRFKEDLMSHMEKILTEKGITVKVVDHQEKEFSSLKAEDFDAVFITNSGVNSKIRPWIQDWLKPQKDYASRIILHTTQTREWDVNPVIPVDAITSASKVKSSQEFAREYVEKIVAIVSATPETSQEEMSDDN